MLLQRNEYSLVGIAGTRSLSIERVDAGEVSGDELCSLFSHAANDDVSLDEIIREAARMRCRHRVAAAAAEMER